MLDEHGKRNLTLVAVGACGRRAINRAMPRRTAPATLRENIIRLRNLRGWGQNELAKRAGVSSVAMIESGERIDPSYMTVKLIADALEVTPDELVFGPVFRPELLKFLSEQGDQITEDEKIELARLPFSGSPSSGDYAIALLLVRNNLKRKSGAK